MHECVGGYVGGYFLMCWWIFDGESMCWWIDLFLCFKIPFLRTIYHPLISTTQLLPRHLLMQQTCNLYKHPSHHLIHIFSQQVIQIRKISHVNLCKVNIHFYVKGCFYSFMSRNGKLAHVTSK